MQAYTPWLLLAIVRIYHAQCEISHIPESFYSLGKNINVCLFVGEAMQAFSIAQLVSQLERKLDSST